MLSKYFQIQELVHPDFLQLTTEQGCWMLIPKQVITALDTVRAEYGEAITLNSGLNHSCGVRPKNDPVGALLSGHKLTRGLICFDLHAYDLVRLRNQIITNAQRYGVCQIEVASATPTWVHIAFNIDGSWTGLVEVTP